MLQSPNLEYNILQNPILILKAPIYQSSASRDSFHTLRLPWALRGKLMGASRCRG